MWYLKLSTHREADMELKRKVYFIACCFPPFGRGNAITNSCVANYLAEDFAVKVICMQREEGGLIAYQEDRSLEESLHPEMEVERIRAANWRGLNIVLYALGILPCYYLNWAWSVWRQRESLFDQAGAVFAVYPVFSDLVVGFLVSRRYGFPLLVDFRDDFSGVMSSGWRKVLRPVYRFLEKRIIRAADRVSVTTESLRADLLERYELAPEKVEVVYNIVPPAAPVAIDGERDGDSSPLRIIYAGAMSRAQKPEILLWAYAHLLARDSSLPQALEVELYGPESRYFSAKIRRLLTRGCSFGGFVPQAEMARHLAITDIGFFSLSDATYSYATPTKLFDYIEAGVPIVASLPDGAARTMVERYKIGLVADAGDVVGLAHCLQEMVENKALRDRCRDNMKAIRDEFRPQIQVDKWSKMLVGMDVKKNASTVASWQCDTTEEMQTT
jgi:glycosyltransferase involved in cell wall biosynthesis